MESDEIDFDTAVSIATHLIGQRHGPDAHLFVLDLDNVMAVKYGWVFGYNTKEFVETRNWGYAAVGLAAFMVLRKAGRVVQFVTARPVAEQVAAYEASVGA